MFFGASSAFSLPFNKPQAHIRHLKLRAECDFQGFVDFLVGCCCCHLQIGFRPQNAVVLVRSSRSECITPNEPKGQTLCYQCKKLYAKILSILTIGPLPNIFGFWSKLAKSRKVCNAGHVGKWPKAEKSKKRALLSTDSFLIYMLIIALHKYASNSN